MKKFFFLAIALVAAVSMNAATLSFTEVKAAGSLNGQTLGSGNLTLTITDAGDKVSVDENKTKFGDADGYWQSEFRLKTGGKSSSNNTMTLHVAEAGTLYIYARTGSNSATDRNIVLTKSESEVFNHTLLESEAISVSEESGDVSVYPIFTVEVTAGDYVVTYPVGSVNIYGFGLNEKIGSEVTAVENVKVSSPAQKVIENGQLIIIKNGVRYNSLGAKL